MAACLFCGATGKMTREHVFRAKWPKLLGMDPKKAEDLRRFGWNLNEEGQVERIDETYRGRFFDDKLKGVCVDCNGGWMNDLENAVEPFLVPMVMGRPRPLRRQQTRDLEHWIAKTAIVLAKAGGYSNAYTTEQAHCVGRDRELPDNFYVWVMARPHEGTLAPRLSPLMYNTTKPVAVVTTIVFGAVCFVAFHASRPDLAPLWRTLGEMCMGPPLQDRRGLWMCPEGEFVSEHPGMYPDIHSILLRTFMDIAPKEFYSVPEGTNFPFPG